MTISKVEGTVGLFLMAVVTAIAWGPRREGIPEYWMHVETSVAQGCIRDAMAYEPSIWVIGDSHLTFLEKCADTRDPDFRKRMSGELPTFIKK